MEVIDPIEVREMVCRVEAERIEPHSNELCGSAYTYAELTGYVWIGVSSWAVLKKQASDQSFHDRRYQERERAEAAKKPAPKKPVSEESSRTTEATKENSSK